MDRGNINKDPIKIGIIKWLDRYYGKDPSKIELGDEYYRLVCDPISFYHPEEGEDVNDYMFSYLSVSKSLSIHRKVREEIENFFDPNIETLKSAIGEWFEKKFGGKVIWYGWWS